MSEIKIVKEKKRQELKLRRNKNIKRAIAGLVVFMILLVIGNGFYNRYREKVYRDKQYIINMNDRKMRTFIDYLERENRLISDLLFEVECDKDFERGRLITAYNATQFEGIERISYDYELYHIDSMGYHNFFYSSHQSIVNGLKKETLTEEDKKVLAEIMKVNRGIIGVYEDYQKIFRDNDHYEELQYIAYYQGEMRYIITNAIYAHIDGFDMSLEIERPETNEGANTYEAPKEITLSGIERLKYVNLLGDVIYGELEDSVAAVKKTEGSETSIVYQSPSFREDEYITFYDQSDYIHYANPYYKVEGTILTEDEMIEKANEFVNQLNQPLLTLNSFNEYTYSDTGHVRTLIDAYDVYYIIQDEHYEDSNTSLSLRYYKDGTLWELSLNKANLLETLYEKEVPKHSQQEVVNSLDLSIQKGIINIVYSPNGRYRVYFKKYGLDFIAYIDDETLEMTGVGEVK